MQSSAFVSSVMNVYLQNDSMIYERWRLYETCSLSFMQFIDCIFPDKYVFYKIFSLSLPRNINGNAALCIRKFYKK